MTAVALNELFQDVLAHMQASFKKEADRIQAFSSFRLQASVLFFALLLAIELFLKGEKTAARVCLYLAQPLVEAIAFILSRARLHALPVYAVRTMHAALMLIIVFEFQFRYSILFGWISIPIAIGIAMLFIPAIARRFFERLFLPPLARLYVRRGLSAF